MDEILLVHNAPESPKNEKLIQAEDIRWKRIICLIFS